TQQQNQGGGLREQRLVELPTFDGTGEDPYQWWKSFNDACNANDIGQEEEQLVDKDVSAYVGTLTDLYQKVGPLEKYLEEDIVQQFLKGLKPAKVENALKRETRGNPLLQPAIVNEVLVNQMEKVEEIIQVLTTEVKENKEICTKCNQRGHAAKNCYTQNPKSNILPKTPCPNLPDCVTCEAEIWGTKVKAVVSTGSSGNIISKQCLDQLKRKIEESSNINLIGINGQRHRPLGIIWNVQVTLENKHTIEVTIVDWLKAINGVISIEGKVLTTAAYETTNKHPIHVEKKPTVVNQPGDEDYEEEIFTTAEWEELKEEQKPTINREIDINLTTKIDGWIRIIEQIFEAYPQLPKGNEPNTKADVTPLDGNALVDENEPGIAWTTTRLANRLRADTNISNVQVIKSRKLGGRNQLQPKSIIILEQPNTNDAIKNNQQPNLEEIPDIQPTEEKQSQGQFQIVNGFDHEEGPELYYRLE
ncbi:4572_t:CDS:2, partial [Entrophospora sp. SA101]